ncbi:pectinesterase family protein [Hymenobacter sp. GOD-10R]|uniref:pectinesterase family protein n=1 Tax=Hymenobacter sp. GOD-10R TaxID=3093922 RepID=UPI002D77088E|nr:pectinesterase family protein [Hymenobacter sp. GOD-10R]WRQ31560.1 pectinesterase family protein [Hymenobacter sp. GOD-10R]
MLSLLKHLQPDNEKTAYYAEYQSKGPGANTKDRVKWSKQLTNKEAKQYTLKNIFAGAEPWLPETKPTPSSTAAQQ